jgi:hypothetical protein
MTKYRSCEWCNSEGFHEYRYDFWLCCRHFHNAVNFSEEN